MRRLAYGHDFGAHPPVLLQSSRQFASKSKQATPHGGHEIAIDSPTQMSA
ncbi:MAG TPA: hypothetical protein VF723_00505 [Pyrinomonadaceae bacterium]